MREEEERACDHEWVMLGKAMRACEHEWRIAYSGYEDCAHCEISLAYWQQERIAELETEYSEACEQAGVADIRLRDVMQDIAKLRVERIAELEAQVKQLREALILQFRYWEHVRDCDNCQAEYAWSPDWPEMYQACREALRETRPDGE